MCCFQNSKLLFPQESAQRADDGLRQRGKVPHNLVNNGCEHGPKELEPGLQSTSLESRAKEFAALCKGTGLLIMHHPANQSPHLLEARGEPSLLPKTADSLVPELKAAGHKPKFISLDKPWFIINWTNTK